MVIFEKAMQNVTLILKYPDYLSQYYTSIEKVLFAAHNSRGFLLPLIRVMYKGRD